MLKLEWFLLSWFSSGQLGAHTQWWRSWKRAKVSRREHLYTFGHFLMLLCTGYCTRTCTEPEAKSCRSARCSLARILQRIMYAAFGFTCASPHLHKVKLIHFSAAGHWNRPELQVPGSGVWAACCDCAAPRVRRWALGRASRAPRFWWPRPLRRLPSLLWLCAQRYGLSAENRKLIIKLYNRKYISILNTRYRIVFLCQLLLQRSHLRFLRS